MKYITIILLFLCLMSCHNGRQSSCENVPVEKDSVQLRVIPVSISDTAYRNVDQLSNKSRMWYCRTML